MNGPSFMQETSGVKRRGVLWQRPVSKPACWVSGVRLPSIGPSLPNDVTGRVSPQVESAIPTKDQARWAGRDGCKRPAASTGVAFCGNGPRAGPLVGFRVPPPSCLQKMAHLELSSIPQVDPSNLWIKPMYSLNRCLRRRAPDGSNHSLYLTKRFNCSNPEGYIGRSHILHGSNSLSPLYPGMTNDMHVSIATSLHESFPCLHPAQA